MKRLTKTLLLAFALVTLVGVVARCLLTGHEPQPQVHTANRPKKIASVKHAIVTNKLERPPAEAVDAAEDDADEIRLKAWEDFLEPYFEETGTNREISVDEMIRAKDLFNSLNDEQRSDEIGHTMNLIPDESIELLYGILFDPAEGADITDTIFCDILNRDENVKMPIMRQLLKIEDHPCYEDAKHILSVIDDDKGDKDDDDDEGDDEEY